MAVVIAHLKSLLGKGRKSCTINEKHVSFTVSSCACQARFGGAKERHNTVNVV